MLGVYENRAFIFENVVGLVTNNGGSRPNRKRRRKEEEEGNEEEREHGGFIAGKAFKMILEEFAAEG